jgi:hypothetical protein
MNLIMHEKNNKRNKAKKNDENVNGLCVKILTE